MDLKEEVQQNNMISNLPLLFANGYPTSLDKISESQLENFIPFMVQCSLGYINLQNNVECSEPEWWPEDLTFTIPFSKPKKFYGNWMEKMKEIVIICYQFHRSVFLLRFCNDLAAYEHASLRFINNQNSTTSLFDRRSNKLLVTFRNENMSYDQPQRTRKCLLQQKQKNERHGSRESQQIMVEPAPFDIYLCDNCDAELYSKEAILEHEKTCKVDDDDVILCDTPEPQESSDIQIDNDQCSNDEQRIAFLLNFDLGLRFDKIKNKKKIESSNTKEENTSFMIIDRNMRLPRRNRTVQSLTRCPTIPLSSPAGQLLLRTTKANVSTEYLMERLERIERFCHAPLLTKSGSRPKYFERKSNSSLPHCTFKKPVEYSSHIYVFPRRQFSQRRRAENFLILNSQLIKRCRPISVRLKKITDHDIKTKHQPPPPSTKLNIKLTRDATRNSNWKISSTSPTTAPITASSSATEIIVDTIDLCSSDEEEQRNNTIQKISPLTVNNNNNNNSNDLVKSVNDEKSSKIRLNGLKKRFNNSEVSLIPIRKAFNNFTNNNNKNDKLSPPLIRLVSSTNVTDRTEKHINSCYEGNILLSPSATISPENGGIALPKPLQPSLYILSNCTNPLAALMTNSNDIISTNGIENGYKTQNQENQLKGKTGITIPRTTDSNNHSLSAAPSEWFGSSSSTGSSSSNNALETECTTGNLTLVPNFNTQNRIVSIDLTS